MFNSGTKNGLRGVIPVGGQATPISIVGARLLWKKAQKKAKKKHTSEVINRIIPYRSPLITISVWCPWNVASRITSRHHFIEVRVVTIKPIRNIFILPK